MQLLAFDFLFFDVFSISNFSEIFVCWINRKRFVFEHCFESFIFSICFEVPFDIPVVLFANQQLEFSGLSLDLLHLLRVKLSLFLNLVLMFFSPLLLILLLLFALPLIGLPGGLIMLLLLLLLLREYLLADVLSEPDVELDVQLVLI